MNKRKNNTSPLKIAVLGHKTILYRYMLLRKKVMN